MNKSGRLFTIAVIGFCVCYLTIAYLALTPSVKAQSGSSGGIQALPLIIGDPCMNSSIAKSSAAVSIAAAGTTAIVPTVAGKAVFVCQFDMTIGGTTATIQFKSGTQTTTPCDTGAANMTGIYAPVSGNEVSAQGSAMIMQTPVASQLCITAAGTGVAIGGVVTFVQQ